MIGLQDGTELHKKQDVTFFTISVRRAMYHVWSPWFEHRYVFWCYTITQVQLLAGHISWVMDSSPENQVRCWFSYYLFIVWLCMFALSPRLFVIVAVLIVASSWDSICLLLLILLSLAFCNISPYQLQSIHFFCPLISLALILLGSNPSREKCTYLSICLKKSKPHRYVYGCTSLISIDTRLLFRTK